ncbi:MAG: hypothetical protein EOP04_00975 [Proteobacteria bacterium]|nr:MAG: hypothetical protein EOP04_00975 [Pseudomonadota bacterium]
MQNFIAFALLGFVLVSCSEKPSNSHLNEGFDSRNSLGLVGYVGAPNFNEIKTQTSVTAARIPWTDTYWPLTHQGLSRRWPDNSTPASTDLVGLTHFYKDHIKKSSGKISDVYLSPAEKYDIAYRWRHNKILDQSRLDSVFSKLNTLENQVSLMEAIPENKAIFGQIYSSSDEISLLDEYFPFSMRGWKSFLSYTSQDKYKFLNVKDSGEDWAWMGLCAGWAPGSFMSETPKHAVMVELEGKEILFTEGDIRGILSKSWDDHSPSDKQYFIGRRCNKNLNDAFGEIPAGESGRGYSGTLRFEKDGLEQSFYSDSQVYVAFTNQNQSVYPVRFEDQEDLSGFLLETYVSGRYVYVFAQTVERLRAYVQSGATDGIRKVFSSEMYGCWDVNPATFHMAILEKIGKQKLGLVIDRTRTAQVWNQPVYNVNFDIEEPVLAASTNDVAAKYRAPGTKYLSKVTATARWVAEPDQPSMSYPAGFDESKLKTSTYVYTLEFDRAKRLIGGEWGSYEEVSSKQVIPDFIFGYEPGAKPKDNIATGFDFSGIVDVIHACSLSNETDGETVVDNHPIKFKKCSLNKLAD